MLIGLRASEAAGLRNGLAELRRLHSGIRRFERRHPPCDRADDAAEEARSEERNPHRERPRPVRDETDDQADEGARDEADQRTDEQTPPKPPRVTGIAALVGVHD